jgi:hypothetical protein
MEKERWELIDGGQKSTKVWFSISHLSLKQFNCSAFAISTKRYQMLLKSDSHFIL